MAEVGLQAALEGHRMQLAEQTRGARRNMPEPKGLSAGLSHLLGFVLEEGKARQGCLSGAWCHQGCRSESSCRSMLMRGWVRREKKGTYVGRLVQRLWKLSRYELKADSGVGREKGRGSYGHCYQRRIVRK